MARRLCDQLGIWEDLAAKGIVDADPFVVDNDKHRYNNLGLPMNFSWQVSSLIADSLDKIFKQKTAIEWEKELSSKGTHHVVIQESRGIFLRVDARIMQVANTLVLKCKQQTLVLIFV